MAFTPTKGTYLLTRLDLAIGWVSGTNGYKLELHADDGGQPGRTIASWWVSRLPNFGDTGSKVETIYAVGPTLSKGHQYWLVPIVKSDEWAGWNWNSVSLDGNGAYSTDGGSTWTVTSYAPYGAFDVLGLKLY
jgi:hypothetical protein